MIEDYQTLVLAEYKRLKEIGKLTLDLSTRGKFRKECLNIFKERYSPDDDDVFAEFFEVDKIDADFYLLLNKSDADDFKAVHNHISGYNKTEATEMKNTELLAWFIDFKPRPSISFYNNQRAKFQTEVETQKGKHPEDEGSKMIKEEGLDTDKESTTANGSTETKSSEISGGDSGANVSTPDPPIDPSVKETTIKRVLQILTSCSIFILVGIGIYQFQQNKPGIAGSFNTLFSSGNEKCMYWTGDSYQAVACDAGPKGGQTIPLDADKMRKFRRVMQPDTLTKDALGKVWYAKRGGTIEFYTDSGAHPTDGNKRLLPVTVYILNKYISYHRYLLNLIFWSAGIIIFSLIFGIGTIYFGRKAKKQRAGTKKQQVKAAA